MPDSNEHRQHSQASDREQEFPPPPHVFIVALDRKGIGCPPRQRVRRKNAFKMMDAEWSEVAKAELWRVNNRRLDGLTAEIRRRIGCAEQERRKGYAELEEIRQVRVRNRRKT